MKVKRFYSPARILVLGFASFILLGTVLLLLPVSVLPGNKVSLVDALFTATSAVCVTGLAVIDLADNFSVFGKAVIALLIQIGGLGFASIGIAFILIAGGNVGLRERILLKEAFNLNSIKGIVKLVKFVLLITLGFEFVGAILSFIVFSKRYDPLSAIGISIFHSISAFNNSGYDILGGFRNLLDYQENVLLNLTTAGLIIFGGMGFFVIREIGAKKKYNKFSMHTKIVLVMTSVLLISGTLLLKLTDNLPWLTAFFHSVVARTAGFSTYPVGDLSNAGLFVLIFLMFIGASPGSTGGGIKTTTAFAAFKSMHSFISNRPCTAFHRKIPTQSIIKAYIIILMALLWVCLVTFIICLMQPEFSFVQVLFETVSAFGTVGLSTGITPSLNTMSKLIISLTMFLGRLGPLTMAYILVFQTSSNVSHAEETIMIG